MGHYHQGCCGGACSAEGQSFSYTDSTRRLCITSPQAWAIVQCIETHARCSGRLHQETAYIGVTTLQELYKRMQDSAPPVHYLLPTPCTFVWQSTCKCTHCAAVMLVPQLERQRLRSTPANCLCIAQLEASHDAATGCMAARMQDVHIGHIWRP